MESTSSPIVTVFSLIYYPDPDHTIQALDSVRLQDYPTESIQHIVINDGCESWAEEKILKWIAKNYPQIEYIKNKKNQGITKNLNKVLALARGKYYFGVSDDTISSHRISRMVKEMEALPEKYAVLYCDIEMREDRTGKTYNYFNRRFLDKGRELPSGNIATLISDQTLIPPITVLIRTSAVRSLGGYDESLYYEDWDLWLNLSVNDYWFKPTEILGGTYRIHDNSVMKSKKFKVTKSAFRVVLKYIGRGMVDKEKMERKGLNLISEISREKMLLSFWYRALLFFRYPSLNQVKKIVSR